MDKTTLRILFYGTPVFAVATLAALYHNHFNIIAVITAPDKPKGRGMKVQESDVKKFATLHHIPVLQPSNLKDPQFIQQLKILNPTLQIVVAFRMMPEAVWNLPPLGTFNVHASLLPQYRGAAPINRAIMNGETITGVTTFKLKHKIDTGNILLQKKVTITPSDTAGTLHDKLKEEGAQLMIQTLELLLSNTLVEIPQTNSNEINEHIHAPKIFPADCEINWNNNFEHILNQIRGLSPYPAAYTYLDGKRLKIISASAEANTTIHAIGSYHTDKKTFLKYTCSNGYIDIHQLQIEGKQKMTTIEFLRGYKFD